jgi:hypothetical protein
MLLTYSKVVKFGSWLGRSFQLSSTNSPTCNMPLQ